MATPVQAEKELLGKAAWKERGFRVPTKALPASVELFVVPGYRNVMRERNLYSRDQVVPIDAEQAARREVAAQKAIKTRMTKMERAIETAELRIDRSFTDEQIEKLAMQTHGGNYAGDPGLFFWSNKKARDTVRQNLTNYEELWAVINRGYTGKRAYAILRERVDALVDEAYPQFADDRPMEHQMSNSHSKDQCVIRN